MLKSLFIKWIATSFEAVISNAVMKINGKKDPLIYLHKTMLRKEFSPTLKWGSATSNGTVIAADIVSLDSSLPIKKRDSMERVEGDIPKVGMLKALNERQMDDLILLENIKGQEKEIMKKLFEDPISCIQGIYERNELLFLQALSSGYALKTDGVSPGLGLRIDYGHPDANKFGVQKPWTDANATPISDIENVISRAKANGDVISHIMMDKSTWNNMKKREEVKELYAMSIGFNGSNIPTPTLAKINDALAEDHKVTIVVVDRVVRTEKDGKQTSQNAWTENAVTFLTQITNVGTLSWGTLAEMKFQAKDVTYTIADDYILVSKFHETNPLKEFSSAQARVVPVIDNMDSIYIMDVSEATEDAQTELDANFDYEGTSYTRASVISAINSSSDETVTSDNTDAELLEVINKLSDAEIEEFESKIVESA